MRDIARPEGEEMEDLRRLGLAIQGMGVCHVVVAIGLLSLFIPISIMQGGLPGLAGLAFVVITGGALFVGFGFVGLAWLLLRGDFLPFRWALILPGGLAGTVVALLTGVINPISEGLALLVAYVLVGRSLRRRRGAPVAHD